MRKVPMALFALAALAATLGASTAQANDTETCDAAYEKAQALRDAKKLTGARDELQVCARTKCPAFMVKDCTAWLSEIEPRIPSVIVVVTDATGSVLPNQAVTLDRGVAARKVDGTSWDVDPGEHTFTVVAPDGTKVRRAAIVVEGQKGQRVALILAATPSAPPEDAGRSRRLLGLVVGSIGLAGVVVGGIFGGLAFSSWSSANRDCPSHMGCTSQAIRERGNAVTFSTVSDVGLIAGGVVLAGGITLYLTAPKDASPRAALHVVPGGISMAARF